MKHFVGLLIVIGMVIAFMVVAECVAAPVDLPATSAATSR